jgi:ferredoxin
MQIDSATAQKATGAAKVIEVTALCEEEIDKAEAAAEDGRTVVACGQMAGLFADIWDTDTNDGSLVCTDIRDRAGWTADDTAFAKQAALLADTLVAPPATPTKDVVSEGVCLILGGGDVALDVARRLSDRLAVTCLLPEAPDMLAPETGFDLAIGSLGSASGALGNFKVQVKGYRAQRFGGRGANGFGDPISSATSACDIILDLRGEGPLFPADHKREGYLRADPSDPKTPGNIAAAASQYQGVFEQPLYIRYDPTICAHSRASQSGCDRCLSVCPTGAIVPDGDHVKIDPNICAGCGACAAVCPSGAASYDDPPVTFLFHRLRTLASTYRDAGGSAPRVLFHDGFGTEMIALSARHGRGLPADVIPVEVSNVESVGHAELVAALAVGFASATVLAGPKTDLTVPQAQLELAKALVARTPEQRLAIVTLTDPDALDDLLYGAQTDPVEVPPILPAGGRREVTRLAATALADGHTDTPLPLPEGAPYGAVVIDTDACTLCLACVSLCPVGALGDNPDKPQVRFQETACLQCGICAATCPETAITLVPQLDLANDAMVHRVLHEEDPFECIECGKPFGVKSTIERIISTLEGKHWMYSGSDNSKLIQMCDDCRINAQYHQKDSPFSAGERPPVRTTDDYLKDKKPN